MSCIIQQNLLQQGFLDETESDEEDCPIVDVLEDDDYSNELADDDEIPKPNGSKARSH